MLLVTLTLVAGVAQAQSASESCVADHRAVQTKRQTGDYLLARDAALRCADARCPKLVREDCAPWYVELEDRLPSLLFQARDARGRDVVDVHITANGRALDGLSNGRAVSVDPGDYRLRFEAKGHRPLELDVVVVEGVKRRTVSVVLEPDLATQVEQTDDTTQSQAGGKRARGSITPAVLTLGAIATVGLTTFAALGVSGKVMFQKLEQSKCKPDCARTEVEHANRTYWAADVAAGVGGAAAIACAIVYLVGRPKAGHDQRARWDAAPLAGGASLSLRGAF
ncbi:MAG: hypothetical protein RLZZ450_723 [Pseudomonadota bacterium]|jgi:hypothetical protein